MNILDFGAKRGEFCGDAIQRAIDAAAVQGGGRVVVPAGEYETASLVLRSNVELHLEAGAVLRFTDDFDAYPVVNIRWEGYEQPCRRPLIYAKNEVNVALTGFGTLEGQGKKWWTAFRAKTLDAARPCAVCFEDCTRVRMSDFMVHNSPNWTIHPVRCENVTIDNLTIVNPFDSPNTDGIDPESCRNVRITGCHIDVGDDCIAVKAGTEDALEDVPCENIAITGCTMVHGHGGVVLGSDGIPLCLNAVEVGKVMAGIYRNWDAGDYTAFCRKFDLPPDKKYKDYSAGMQRKLCIAVALSHHAKLLLLDEATNGLDPVVRDEVVDILLDFARDEERSILISSHIVSDLEKLCDTIAFLHKGRLLLCEEKDALREEYALWHGTAAQLAALDAQVYGKRVTPYGAEALVRRDALPAGAELTPVSIEELFVLMVKEECAE